MSDIHVVEVEVEFEETYEGDRAFEEDRALSRMLLGSSIPHAFVVAIAAGDELFAQTAKHPDVELGTDERRVLLGKLLDNCATIEDEPVEEYAESAIEAYRATDRKEEMMDSFGPD